MTWFHDTTDNPYPTPVPIHLPKHITQLSVRHPGIIALEMVIGVIQRVRKRYCWVCRYINHMKIHKHKGHSSLAAVPPDHMKTRYFTSSSSQMTKAYISVKRVLPTAISYPWHFPAKRKSTTSPTAAVVPTRYSHQPAPPLPRSSTPISAPVLPSSQCRRSRPGQPCSGEARLPSCRSATRSRGAGSARTRPRTQRTSP